MARRGVKHVPEEPLLQGVGTTPTTAFIEVEEPCFRCQKCWMSFYDKKRRFCTQELKVRPMQRYLKALEGDHVNAVGIRHEESTARASMGEWEWSEGFDCEVWRPLVSWSLQDVIEIHKRHNCPPNQLYLKGASRVGCWPCIYARKKEIKLIADIDPVRIDEIRRMEAELHALKLERAKLREEEPRSKNAPGFFQARTGKDGLCWPIDKVVSWSKTSRGGRQLELFDAAPEEEGCMRWGLCETGGKDD